MDANYEFKIENQEVIIKSLGNGLMSKCVTASARMCMMTMRMC